MNRESLHEVEYLKGLAGAVKTIWRVCAWVALLPAMMTAVVVYLNIYESGNGGHELTAVLWGLLIFVVVLFLIVNFFFSSMVRMRHIARIVLDIEKCAECERKEREEEASNDWRVITKSDGRRSELWVYSPSGRLVKKYPLIGGVGGSGGGIDEEE